MVTILILVETLLQQEELGVGVGKEEVTILILVETLLQPFSDVVSHLLDLVTILILVETLLQQQNNLQFQHLKLRHNPYFSGNSFATL